MPAAREQLGTYPGPFHRRRLSLKGAPERFSRPTSDDKSPPLASLGHSSSCTSKHMRSLLGFLLALLAVEGSAAQGCSAAAQTLTTSCGSDSCGAYEPCLAYNASDCLGSSSTGASSNCTVVGDEGCEYKCFRAFGAYNSDPTEFVFLVPYEQQDGGDIYASASNDDVTAIDQLTLSPQTTDVWIQGGGGYQQINRGNVVELALALNLLTSQSQVTSVSFVAMNLSTRISDIPNMVPSSITALSLSNTLLAEFPSHLASLTSLDTLRLSDNYITIVSASISWEKLVVLDLGQNNVASFEGNFPSLTELYLSGNNLTVIPPAIFTFQHLTKLTIQNNPLSTRTFTEAQTTFLLGLANLDLVEGDFQSAADCSLSEQRRVGDNNVVVCVSDLSTSSSISVSTVSSGSSSAPSSRISYSSGSASAGSDRSSSGADQTSSLLVVTIVAAFVVLTALIATAIYYWKQHNGGESNGVYNNMHRASSKQRAMAIWNYPDLLELQVNGDDIQDVRVIGSGAFAVVWLVRYRNSELLASKRLREDAVSERTQAFVDEIWLVSQLDHPNIVSFIGAAWTTGSDLQALFEFVENGDLCTYLSPALPRYWTRVKLQLAVDVIEALVYAHAFTPPLVHRDLKSQSVLISTDMQAKLTDFGVSQFQSTTGIGTNRWLAPELVSGSSDYDPSADIFAFGVLLSEFDTHTLPYADAVGKNGSRLEDVAILQLVASGTLRPTFSDTCPPIILELAKQCMAQEPRDRPPAVKIAYALRTLQREAFNL